MQYLNSFSLASEKEEVSYILSGSYKLEMNCYPRNVYPFQLFPQKGLHTLAFEPVTLLYGGNGSGKSTLLNIIAQKLDLKHDAPFNDTPFYEEYLALCGYEGLVIPDGSKIITSDDVFDFLLTTRSINAGIDQRREELFEEYRATRKEAFTLHSLQDYEELKRHTEAKRKNKTTYVSKRLPGSLTGQSNGESALAYFTETITDHALYLLDEPENSLSAGNQLKLARFLEDSARFYHCQFIISTHSPFLLSLKGARIYDLDARPVCTKPWTKLDSVRLYHDFFEQHRMEFC